MCEYMGVDIGRVNLGCGNCVWGEGEADHRAPGKREHIPASLLDGGQQKLDALRFVRKVVRKARVCAHSRVSWVFTLLVGVHMNACLREHTNLNGPMIWIWYRQDFVLTLDKSWLVSVWHWKEQNIYKIWAYCMRVRGSYEWHLWSDTVNDGERCRQCSAWQPELCYVLG